MDPAQLEQFVSSFQEFHQGRRRQFGNLRIPTGGRFEEALQLPQAFLRKRLSPVLARVRNAFGQHRHGRVDFAAFALVQHDAKHFPDVMHGLEVVALITQDVNQLHDSPALQLFDAGADIGSGHVERFGDFLRMKRFWRNIKQSVNLSDGPIDAPARSHLSPMKDELLLNRAEFHIFLFIQKLYKYSGFVKCFPINSIERTE